MAKLVNIAVGFTTYYPTNAKWGADRNSSEDNAVKTMTEKMKDVDSSDQMSNMFKHATGTDLGGDSVKEGLMKILMGDEGKTELKYGTGGFDKSSIIAYLKNPDDITKLKKQYEDLLKVAKQQEKELTDQASKREYTSEGEAKSKAEANYAAYLSAFTNVLSNVYGFISNVKDAKVSAAQAKINQNKAMLRKLLNIGDKKLDEDFDEIDAFDLDLDV